MAFGDRSLGLRLAFFARFARASPPGFSASRIYGMTPDWAALTGGLPSCAIPQLRTDSLIRHRFQNFPGNAFTLATLMQENFALDLALPWRMVPIFSPSLKAEK
jgi:hypothetical protein